MMHPSLAGPILPLKRERIDHHEDDVLALWERSAPSPSTPARMPWRRVEPGMVAGWLHAFAGAESAVVACSENAPKEWRALVAGLAQIRGPRMYVLAPMSWQTEPLLQDIARKSNSNVLVRLMPESPPACWAVVGNACWLLAGPPGDEPRWCLDGATATGGALLQAFGALFWSVATLEHIPGRSGSQFQRCLATPGPAPKSAELIDFGHARLSRRAPAAAWIDQPEIVVSPGGESWAGVPKLALVAFDRADAGQVDAQAKHGTTVAWRNMDLPAMQVTRQRVVVLASSAAWRLEVAFDAPAISVLLALEDAARQPDWRYHPDRRLGDVQEPVWLSDLRSEIPVVAQIEVPLGALLADSLQSMQTLSPATWPTPPGLALRWRFTWEVRPPLAPRTAVVAEMVLAWRRVDEFVLAQADRIRRQVRQMEGEDSGILSLLRGLTARWNRVKAARSRIADAIDEVTELPASRRPQEATELLQKLAAQHASWLQLKQDAHTDRRQEELRVAEEAQRAAYADRQRQLAQESEALDLVLRAIGQQRSERCSDLDSLAMKLAAAETSWADFRTAAHAERDRAIAAQSSELDNEIEAARKRVAGLEKRSGQASKADRQRATAELGQAQTDVRNLQRRKGALTGKAPGTAEPPPGELLVARAEIDGVRKAITELDARTGKHKLEADRLQKAQARPFEFLPPTPGSPVPLDALPPAPPVPSEPLPQLGELLEAAGQRYLAISKWEELPVASAESTRLSARLVAKVV